MQYFLLNFSQSYIQKKNKSKYFNQNLYVRIQKTVKLVNIFSFYAQFGYKSSLTIEVNCYNVICWLCVCDCQISLLIA